MNKLSYNNLIKLFNTEKHYFYITLVNKYNYQIKQIKINKDDKTIKTGAFSFNENITNKTSLNNFINFLKLIDYKEI